MAYKIMQKDEDGVMREVVVRGETVRGADFNPSDIELKQFDDETRSFTAVGSTGNPDRVEDIIDQNGWLLDNFLKNPVGMWAHNYTMLPIFGVSDLEVKPRSKKMVFRANFDDYEFADNVYQSYKKKFMRGFSVGFLPITYEQRDREDMTEEEKQRAGWWGGLHFITQELLEISAAPIPMHPEALADMKQMGIPTEFAYGSTNLTPCRSTMNDGSIWIPIDDVNRFTDLTSVSLDSGVKAVSGTPIAGADDVVLSGVAGYIFPRGMEDDDMVEWLHDHGMSEDKACALVTDDLGKYVELSIGDNGEFKLSDSDKIEYEEEPEVDDDDIVKTDVDKQREKFVIIPEGVEIQEDGLHIETSIGSFTLGTDILEQAGLEIIGSFTLGTDILEQAGLEIREDELVDVRNRNSFDEAIETLTLLVKDLKIKEQEPEPEQDAQQEDQAEVGEEDFALLLTVAEEAKNEIDVEGIDPEMFRSVLGEVLTEAIPGLIKSSVDQNLREATGDLD